MIQLSPAHSRALEVCLAKTEVAIARLAESPKSGAFAVDGDYFAFREGFFEIGNWTSSFFTGLALLSYERTGKTGYLEQCLRLETPYRRKVTTHAADTMHDLGFLYSLYSVALYKITGAKEHRDLGVRAAEVLAGRFVSPGGYIRAWGRMDESNTDYAGLAIIDCLMNLPLLFWASEVTGDKRFHDIAVSHADVTVANFVRADDSVFHSYRFDLKTGRPAGGDNYCGQRVDSHWARGTTWAIYGLAIAYGYTQKKIYLETSLRLARRFVALLDSELVPVWDFKLSAGCEPVRDSSAAAIAACGLLELARLAPQEKNLAEAAHRLLDRLSSADYLDSNPSCLGILKKGQVGDGVGSAKSAYTSWGDYYFMEALLKQDPAFRPYW